MIFMSVTCLILSIAAFMDPELTKIVGLAWDCGAVTTGPVTVPLVLALGIGVNVLQQLVKVQVLHYPDLVL